MKPPKAFKVPKNAGYSKCFACDKWKFVNIFFHDGSQWNLCHYDYEDYWLNTDVLLPDYRSF